MHFLLHFISSHLISFRARSVRSRSFVLARERRRDGKTRRSRVATARVDASSFHACTHSSCTHHSCIVQSHPIPSSARARRASTSSLASFARALVSRFDVKKAAVESRLQKLSRASVTGRATWGWKESFQPAIFRDQSRLHIDGYNPMRKDASRDAPG